MDPDVALQEIRRLSQAAVRMNDGLASFDALLLINTLDELATAVAALDGWLSAGGFLPAEWRRVGG